MKSSNITANLPLNNQDAAGAPYNHVETTVAGHEFRVDNTVGNETITRRHAKGTYEEWDANGGRVLVVKGRNFEAVVGDSDIIVTGQCNITVNGSCSINATEDLTALAKSIHLTDRKSVV